jgi:hypothetical protein
MQRVGDFRTFALSKQRFEAGTTSRASVNKMASRKVKSFRKVIGSLPIVRALPVLTLQTALNMVQPKHNIAGSHVISSTT